MSQAVTFGTALVWMSINNRYTIHMHACKYINIFICKHISMHISYVKRQLLDTRCCAEEDKVIEF